MMLENLLKDVEQLVTKKEFEVDQGQACNPEEVEAANIQLIKIQKCLTEKHFKNQSNRKVILSDATDSQTLSMEKRKAVVDLARKQRNLLEVFKKYKSLSERVRSISSKKIGPCTLSNTRRKTLFHANVQNDITLTCTPSSESNQFHLSEDANSKLSLEALVGRGILKAGKNVLSTASEGRLYSASLSDNGRIISTGGEGFKSPRSWIKAICGSKRKVKNDVAWKMVLYKNKPLLEYALTTVAPETFETATTAQATSSTENNRRKSCKEVITTAEGLKSLLKNCRVTGIDKNEILSVPVEMQGDFWDNDEFELMNVDVLNDRQIKD
ncbi:uncharacterized protein LOC124435224 [Xenia sp. Carnegie-2017]|uniref:uncharacterized protein LOC124435224 n=1 Tax=Xenia sp. Carnegie-2017 TaxID=2897299 RepID=UPI001F03C980|nr:uncharacterized protein LOC124435224 [Xenia sp. Carnegie-2017]